MFRGSLSWHLLAPLFKVSKRCEICSKLKIKAPEGRQWRCGLTSNTFTPFSVFIVGFEYISVSWVSFTVKKIGLEFVHETCLSHKKLRMRLGGFLIFLRYYKDVWTILWLKYSPFLKMRRNNPMMSLHWWCH